MGVAGGLRTGRSAVQRVCALAIAVVLAFFGVVATSTSASAAGEGTILALVNQDRAANGLGPLTLNSSISSVSAAWANQMAANGAMTHNPSFSSQIPGGWSKAGENVAQGFATPADVHYGWMNSPGHRANILGDYTDIGIAFISAGGTTWAVENFAKYGSSVPAPAPPAPPPPPPAPPAPPAPTAAPSTTPAPPTSSESPRAASDGSATGHGSPAAPSRADTDRSVSHSAPASGDPTEADSPQETTSAREEASAAGNGADSGIDTDRFNVESQSSVTGIGAPILSSAVMALGILLGLLVVASSVWTGLRLRRRWQK